MAEEDRRNNDKEIVPGMKVEATEGDLGEQDVSPAKVTDVVKNRDGNVEAIKISKGNLFRKELDVPSDRIQQVEPASSDDRSTGKVIIDAREEELESLRAPGPQTLARESERPQEDLLDPVEQRVPTTEGMREMESGIHATRPQSTFLRVIGPGLLSGTSGNDPSAVTVYAVDGANAGYGHLWLMLLTTPLYFAVEFACAKIGRISQKGLSQLLRVNPIKLILWSNIIAAIIAPLLVIAILLVGNHRNIMKDQRLSLLHNFALVLITLIMLAGAVLFFYQLATGQGR